jgi:hypothetical protein
MSKRDDGTRIHLTFGQAELLWPLRDASLALARLLGWPDKDVGEVFVAPVSPARFPYSVWSVRVHFRSGVSGVGCHVLKFLVCDRTQTDHLEGEPRYEVREVRYGVLSQCEDNRYQPTPDSLSDVSGVRFFPADPLQGWVQAVTFGSGTSVRTLWHSDPQVTPEAAQGEEIHWQAPFTTLYEHCVRHTVAEHHAKAAVAKTKAAGARFYM